MVTVCYCHRRPSILESAGQAGAEPEVLWDPHFRRMDLPSGENRTSPPISEKSLLILQIAQPFKGWFRA